MEIKEIIIIIMFVQLVIVTFMCVRNAERHLELIDLIQKLNKLHTEKENLTVEMIKNVEQMVENIGNIK